MRVFLGGATGAIGLPLAKRLVGLGHHVFGTTRSDVSATKLAEIGIEPIVVDAFDKKAVETAMARSKPDAVLHQLTALAKDATPRALKKSLADTARLRRETVPIFVAAARNAGARRFVVQSISFVTPPEGPRILDESAPIWSEAPRDFRETLDAVAALESAALAAPDLQPIVLRYGFFYGPSTWYAPDGTMGKMIARGWYPIVGSGQGLASFIHIDDAVKATVASLERGEPGIYNITDDEPIEQTTWLPFLAAIMKAKPPRHVPAWMARLGAGSMAVHYSTSLRGASNAKAKNAFAWQPRPWRQGFSDVFGAGARD